ncbi:MAG: CPBP family intramembrane metalloprotease [Planctomycetaceae bacterium]|nr:CPBP family intramembrane metalloprotease [Planctomycetaceae bacterium]
MKSAVVLLFFAAAGFFLLFSPWTKPIIPFWLLMPLLTASLALLSIYLDHARLAGVYAFKAWHIPVGVVSAAVLYGFFMFGHFLSTRILPFAQVQIESIYAIRQDHNRWLIALLLVGVIAPAEEIFWRGFLQRRLTGIAGILPASKSSEHRNAIIGFVVAAAAYALVHVWSLNLMLVAAAAVCGFFWGLLFLLTRSLWPCIISHALWDILIFILLPVG